MPKTAAAVDKRKGDDAKNNSFNPNDFCGFVVQNAANRSKTMVAVTLGKVLSARQNKQDGFRVSGYRTSAFFPSSQQPFPCRWAFVGAALTSVCASAPLDRIPFCLPPATP